IIWYLIHQNVWVWVDDADKWYVQFNTPCKKLEEGGRCGWYAHRPKLCQDYKQAECPRYNSGPAEKFLFKDEEQFLSWLAHSRSRKLTSLHQRYLVQRARRWQRKSKN
ncbi:MAG: YkgJ family cysteine cluster protein, partial [candidate division KSB1 bacterium]